MFWALVVVALLGALGWVAQSPWFSIAHIAVSGVTSSDTQQILDAAGVVEGTPLIAVAPSRVEVQLEADPWVVEATVRRVLPDAVEVAVEERTPFAWVQTGSGWAVIAEDGIVLRTDPEAQGPSLVLEIASRGRGDRLIDPRIVGGVAFLGGLPDDMRSRVVVSEQDGELWATVEEMAVRLGLPTEMEEKAAALVAILEEGVPPGSVINLIAPTRPAVVEA
jgi:cell division protein FtsQ